MIDNSGFYNPCFDSFGMDDSDIDEYFPYIIFGARRDIAKTLHCGDEINTEMILFREKIDDENQRYASGEDTFLGIFDNRTNKVVLEPVYVKLFVTFFEEEFEDECDKLRFFISASRPKISTEALGAEKNQVELMHLIWSENRLNRLGAFGEEDVVQFYGGPDDPTSNRFYINDGNREYIMSQKGDMIEPLDVMIEYAQYVKSHPKTEEQINDNFLFFLKI